MELEDSKGPNLNLESAKKKKKKTTKNNADLFKQLQVIHSQNGIKELAGDNRR